MLPVMQLLAVSDPSSLDYSNTAGTNAAATGILAAVGGVMFVIFAILVVLGIFTIWMFIDAIIRNDNEYPNGSGKIMWILLILFIGFIPAVIYFFVVKKKIPRGSGGQSTPPAAGPTPPPAA